MILAHKIQLDPTMKQQVYFNKAVGTTRFVYNWALAEWDRQYKIGKKPSGLSLKKQFNQIKYQKFPWLKEIHRDAHSQPFANLQIAYNKFFRRKGNHPKFKKRGKRDSFYIANDRFKIEKNKIRLPKIGWVKLVEILRFEGKITSAVISRKVDRWFVSVMVDVKDYAKPRKENNIVGIDLGLIHFVTLSTGEKVKSPKPLKTKLKKLRTLSKNYSRKLKGSNNKKKSAMKLARLHFKISNIRNDFLHKLTTRLCCENQAIMIEDLAVSSMVKNRKLSRAISDAGWHEFRRQLKYKSRIYGTKIIVADRFFPSSKMCSNCGCIKTDLSLSDRLYKCNCGVEIDRDVNAALNIRAFGLRVLKARGEKIRPVRMKAILREAGTKTCSLVDTG